MERDAKCILPAPKFPNGATRSAFESCLFEVCERSQWLLHAFVIMSNHFHLALETASANIHVR
jgi:REP element-mobilizing transposase RayT